MRIFVTESKNLGKAVKTQINSLFEYPTGETEEEEIWVPVLQLVLLWCLMYSVVICLVIPKECLTVTQA